MDAVRAGGDTDDDCLQYRCVYSLENHRRSANLPASFAAASHVGNNRRSIARHARILAFDLIRPRCEDAEHHFRHRRHRFADRLVSSAIPFELYDFAAICRRDRLSPDRARVAARAGRRIEHFLFFAEVTAVRVLRNQPNRFAPRKNPRFGYNYLGFGYL